jgi:hypothetical protein
MRDAVEPPPKSWRIKQGRRLNWTRCECRFCLHEQVASLHTQEYKDPNYLDVLRAGLGLQQDPEANRETGVKVLRCGEMGISDWLKMLG